MFSSTWEKAFWLGENPRLWAMAHGPVDDAGAPVKAARAVVFCSPFAEEEKCSRRLYVDLARALAVRGTTSLRFSYGGTCDSEGEFSIFRLETARRDIRRAISYCGNTLGSPSAVFGIRLGGGLALDTLSDLPGVDRIALWSPVSNGRSYARMNFRRKAIRQMLIAGQDAGPDVLNPSAERSSSDLFDFDGYGVAADLWNELEAFRPAPPAGWGGEALVVSVGPVGRPSAECAAVHESIQAGGGRSQLECVVAQPFWNLLGLVECPEIVGLTADWLARDGGG